MPEANGSGSEAGGCGRGPENRWVGGIAGGGAEASGGGQAAPGGCGGRGARGTAGGVGSRGSGGGAGGCARAGGVLGAGGTTAAPGRSGAACEQRSQRPLAPRWPRHSRARQPSHTKKLDETSGSPQRSHGIAAGRRATMLLLGGSTWPRGCTGSARGRLGGARSGRGSRRATITSPVGGSTVAGVGLARSLGRRASAPCAVGMSSSAGTARSSRSGILSSGSLPNSACSRENSSGWRALTARSGSGGEAAPLPARTPEPLFEPTSLGSATTPGSRRARAVGASLVRLSTGGAAGGGLAGRGAAWAAFAAALAALARRTCWASLPEITTRAGARAGSESSSSSSTS